ncbi:hypothetical protein MRX96_059883 [Rhipicephalus microplus]
MTRSRCKRSAMAASSKAMGGRVCYPCTRWATRGIDDSVTMQTLGDGGLDAKAGRLRLSPCTRWATEASMTRSRCKRSAMAASTSKLADCASSPCTRWAMGASMTRSRCKRSAMAASTKAMGGRVCYPCTRWATRGIDDSVTMQTLGDGGLDAKAGRLRLFPMHTLGDGGHR